MHHITHGKSPVNFKYFWYISLIDELFKTYKEKNVSLLFAATEELKLILLYQRVRGVREIEKILHSRMKIHNLQKRN